MRSTRILGLKCPCKWRSKATAVILFVISPFYTSHGQASSYTWAWEPFFIEIALSLQICINLYGRMPHSNKIQHRMIKESIRYTKPPKWLYETMVNVYTEDKKWKQIYHCHFTQPWSKKLNDLTIYQKLFLFKHWIVWKLEVLRKAFQLKSCLWLCVGPSHARQLAGDSCREINRLSRGRSS